LGASGEPPSAFPAPAEEEDAQAIVNNVMSRTLQMFARDTPSPPDEII